MPLGFCFVLFCFVLFYQQNYRYWLFVVGVMMVKERIEREANVRSQ